VALTGAARADIFFIPEIHFAGETPELDDEGCLALNLKIRSGG
jgi:hypothetical protein